MGQGPTVDRPDMPAAYGPQRDLEGVLAWEWAERRLARSRNYWVATTSADGAPHVAPVWGVWIGGTLWFGTDPSSAKARHLARDDRVVVHLESGDEAVIVHGRGSAVPVSSLDRATRRGLDDAYGAKYVDPDSGDALRLTDGPEGAAVHRVVPRKVLGWQEAAFPASRTRWTFPG